MAEGHVDSSAALTDEITMWGLTQMENEEVLKKLKEIGVSNTDDLKYVQPEKDFKDILSPIQCRKIQAKIFEGDRPAPLLVRSLSSGSGKSDLSDFDIHVVSPNDVSPSTSSSETSGCGTIGLLSPSQNWLASFHIPYNKFPPDLIEVCEKGERPKSCERLEMIRILCSEIKSYCRLPGKKNLLLIANRLCAKYPNSFCDVVGEEVIGNGVSSLVQQMADRMINAYGRGKKRSLDSASPGNRGEANYGCIDFNPKLPEGTTEENLQQMKLFLCKEAMKPEADRDNDKDKIYMDVTYALQRALINTTNPIPTIRSIKEAWPLLFEYKYMMSHFKRLTGIDLEIQMNKSVCEKRDRLLNFISEKRSKTKGVKENLQKLTAVQETTLTDALLLKLVVLCFGEEPDLLIKEYEELTNGSEVERQTKILPPHIAVIGDVLDPTAEFWLVVEKTVVNQNIDNLMEAINTVFAAYYVLNLSYEEGLVGTMEFIQRCLVNLNPSKGSKSGKKGRAVPTKVLSFINALNAMEWNM